MFSGNHLGFVAEDWHDHERVHILYIGRQVVNAGKESGQLGHLVAEDNLARGVRLASHSE